MWPKTVALYNFKTWSMICCYENRNFWVLCYQGKYIWEIHVKSWKYIDWNIQKEKKNLDEIIWNLIKILRLS